MHSTRMKERSEDGGENEVRNANREEESMKISQSWRASLESDLPGRPGINTSQKQNCKIDKTQGWSVFLKLHKLLMRKITQNTE